MLRRAFAPFAPAIAITAALVLAACGGGDDDGASDTSSTTTTVVITTTTTDPEAEPDEPFCVTFRTFSEVIGDLPTNTLAQLRARTVQIRAAATSLSEVAPEELEDETETIRSGAVDLEAAVAEASTLEEAQQAAAPIVTDEAYTAAAEALETWVTDACGED